MYIYIYVYIYTYIYIHVHAYIHMYMYITILLSFSRTLDQNHLTSEPTKIWHLCKMQNAKSKMQKSPDVRVVAIVTIFAGVKYSFLQLTNTLQHTTLHYHTLQHTATHCNTL